MQPEQGVSDSKIKDLYCLRVSGKIHTSKGGGKFMTSKTVLSGKEWNKYLTDNNLTDKDQMELYRCTHNYTAIYKIGEYFFCFRIRKGYKNLAALKRLV